MSCLFVCLSGICSSISDCKFKHIFRLGMTLVSQENCFEIDQTTTTNIFFQHIEIFLGYHLFLGHLKSVLPNRIFKKCPWEHDAMCPSEHELIICVSNFWATLFAQTKPLHIQMVRKGYQRWFKSKFEIIKIWLSTSKKGICWLEIIKN